MSRDEIPRLQHALRNGRRFLGFERDAKYHEIATKRLGYTREQRSLAL